MVKVVKAGYEIMSNTHYMKEQILLDIEKAGRVCYKSEDKITDTSHVDLIKHLIKRGHESVLEHGTISVKFICDRGVSHEMVRHRLASYSQESTRYCNYSKEKFGREITVISIEEGILEEGHKKEVLSDVNVIGSWYKAMKDSEIAYFDMLDAGMTPQIARSVLPNSLKTEIYMTCNIRQWREVMRQRASKFAHPQMRNMMKSLLNEFKEIMPLLFNDIN